MEIEFIQLIDIIYIFFFIFIKTLLPNKLHMIIIHIIIVEYVFLIEFKYEFLKINIYQ
jgi:hypothetical protein